MLTSEIATFPLPRRRPTFYRGRKLNTFYLGIVCADFSQ